MLVLMCSAVVNPDQLQFKYLCSRYQAFIKVHTDKGMRVKYGKLSIAAVVRFDLFVT
jgi:hypothetical protein